MQRADRLVRVREEGRAARDHERVRRATQGIGEQFGEGRVAIRDVRGHAREPRGLAGLGAVARFEGKSLDHLAERKERFVDRARLFEPSAMRVGRAYVLGAGEVEERDLAVARRRRPARAVVVVERVDVHGEDGVRARRVQVHLVNAARPVLEPLGNHVL